MPVRVDADRRPDVNERYNLEGWPTTALLTPSGEMLTGTTYLPPNGLRRCSRKSRRHTKSGAQELDQRADRLWPARRARSRPPPLPWSLIWPRRSGSRRVIDECDVMYGGFGAGGKFLHIAALTVALGDYARRAARPCERPSPERSMRWPKGIRDGIDGGFFRYVSIREWMRPHTEKMLEDQAGLLELLLEAGRVFRSPTIGRCARDHGYVHHTLATRADGLLCQPGG